MSKRKMLGVCSWLSERFDLDVSGLRIIFIAALLFGFGSPLLLYFLLYLIKPSQY
tara:strand:- start:399 stop:563 length:165 start_codon:yes stop_codon:yes gene_type:complete